MRISYGKSKSDAVAKLEGTFVPRDKKRRAPDVKKRAAKQLRQSVPIIPQAAAATATTAVAEQPNKILFLSNLPEEMNEAGVAMLFQRCAGFNEV